MLFYEYACTPGGIERFKIRRPRKRNTSSSTSSESMDSPYDPYADFERRAGAYLRQQRRPRPARAPLPYSQDPYLPYYLPPFPDNHYQPMPTMSRVPGRAHSIDSNDDFFTDADADQSNHANPRVQNQRLPNNEYNAHTHLRGGGGHVNDDHPVVQADSTAQNQQQKRSQSQTQNRNTKTTTDRKSVRTFDRACTFLYQTLNQSIQFFGEFIRDFDSDSRFTTTISATKKQQWQERIRFQEAHGSEDLEHARTSDENNEQNATQHQEDRHNHNHDHNPNTPASCPSTHVVSFHELREQVKRHIRDILDSEMPPVIPESHKPPSKNQSPDNTFTYRSLEQLREAQEIQYRTALYVHTTVKGEETEVMKLLDKMALDRVDAGFCVRRLKSIMRTVEGYLSEYQGQGQRHGQTGGQQANQGWG